MDHILRQVEAEVHVFASGGFGEGHYRLLKVVGSVVVFSEGHQQVVYCRRRDLAVSASIRVIVLDFPIVTVQLRNNPDAGGDVPESNE